MEVFLKELIERRRIKLEADDKTGSDELRLEILSVISENRNDLSVETILEGLASTGAAPSVLYDDNGHWTIGEDGTQNLPTIGDDHKTKPTTFDGVWFVEAGRWKKTVREAMNDYLDDLNKP